MKKIRRLAVVFALIATLSAAAVPIASAAYTPEPEASVARVDETEWLMRIYNGRWQKRLWSYTEGKWLTDWIDL